MRLTEPRQWLRVWLGALTTGLLALVVVTIAVISTVGGTSDRAATVTGALVLAAAVVGAGALSYATSRTPDSAIGMLAGYGGLSLISGGECTLLMEPAGGRGLAAGLVGYPILLVVSLAVGAITFAVRDRRRS